MSKRINFSGIHAFAAILAASAVLSSVPATAQDSVIIQGEPQPLRSVRVTYANLDLTTPSGVKALHQRVGGAVERVCLREIGRDGLQVAAYYACASDAWQRARPRINEVISNASDYALLGSTPVSSMTITVSAS